MNPYPPPPAWAHDFRSVGITGTNGKTSTAHFVSAALTCAGGPVGRISTVDSARLEAGETVVAPPPPDHPALIEIMRSLHARGGRHVALEVTSATLALGFAHAWPFEVAVFTNLGHDHQRTHGSFEHYLAAKAQLFVNLPPGGAAVLNAGDVHAALIAEVLPAEVRALWFAGPGAALDRSVDLRVTRALPGAKGLQLELELAPHLGTLPATIELSTLPLFQADNAAAALLAGLALGLPGPALASAIARCPAPPGRFELIPIDRPGPTVIVDYAHTPEALRAAVLSARALNPRRVILVIGAGGDADSSKRVPLGVEARLADQVYLTSDNPRHEDPAAIVAQLEEGVAGALPTTIELDRSRAIEAAITHASEHDLVLIAGKGHETTQEIAGFQHPLDDRDVARDALQRRP